MPEFVEAEAYPIQSGARARGERCPRCDVTIERVKVGGRTSYFCPHHQR